MMFTAPRYLTRGIANRLPLELQMVIWDLLDSQRCIGEPMDYLQVFELSVENAMGESVQKIVHSQEVPPTSETHYYRGIASPVSLKVWVIDSDEYVTMLFPEEY